MVEYGTHDICEKCGLTKLIIENIECSKENPRGLRVCADCYNYEMNHMFDDWLEKNKKC